MEAISKGILEVEQVFRQEKRIGRGLSITERMTSAEGIEIQNGIVNLGYTTQFNIPHHKYQGSDRR